jgi:large subunit ribosomal protein L13
MRFKDQKTYATTPKDIERKWWVVDARGQTLGRLASQIAPYLTGKNKPNYVDNLDVGDYVIVINSEKIHVTGNRLDDKKYYRYSGYPGGLRTTTLRRLMETHPERALEFAVKGMLPKGPRGRDMYRKLKVYVGDQHPHAAQNPEVLEFKRR